MLWSNSSHQDRVFSVAWLPDSRFSASGGEDSTIRVFEVATGKDAKSERDTEKGIKLITEHSSDWPTFRRVSKGIRLRAGLDANEKYAGRRGYLRCFLRPPNSHLAKIVADIFNK